MNRSFSPQNNFQNSPRGFQNNFRMQSNQNFQQRMQFRSPNSSPSFSHNNYNSPREVVRHKNDFVSLSNESNQNYPQRMQFRSPNSSPGFSHNNYNSPSEIVRHKNDFVNLGNEFPSPRFQSSPRNFSPRSVAPYRSNNSSFNNSWNNRSSKSSGRNSSSYFADVSSSPYSLQNRHKRFQSKQNQDFQNDSNPGHSNNIEDYIHPSMLEDPWKNDMIQYERKMSLKAKKVDTPSV